MRLSRRLTLSDRLSALRLHDAKAARIRRLGMTFPREGSVRRPDTLGAEGYRDVTSNVGPDRDENAMPAESN